MQNETEMNGLATPEETTKPVTPEAKKAAKSKPKAKTATAKKSRASGAKRKVKSAKRAKKTAASRASSKPASARPKRRGKVPGHWSATHAQLVIHAHPSLIAKLDKRIAKLGKSLKLDKPTRGSIVRALVERAVR